MKWESVRNIVFERISSLLDIRSYRRQFAQELKEGRLRSPDLDLRAALFVSHCLGHNRIDIIFGHDLR